MLFAADLVCFVSSLCEVDDILIGGLLTLFSKEALEVIIIIIIIIIYFP